MHDNEPIVIRTNFYDFKKNGINEIEVEGTRYILQLDVDKPLSTEKFRPYSQSELKVVLLEDYVKKAEPSIELTTFKDSNGDNVTYEWNISNGERVSLDFDEPTSGFEADIDKVFLENATYASLTKRSFHFHLPDKFIILDVSYEKPVIESDKADNSFKKVKNGKVIFYSVDRSTDYDKRLIELDESEDLEVITQGRILRDFPVDVALTGHMIVSLGNLKDSSGRYEDVKNFVVAFADCTMVESDNKYYKYDKVFTDYDEFVAWARKIKVSRKLEVPIYELDRDRVLSDVTFVLSTFKADTRHVVVGVKYK